MSIGSWRQPGASRKSEVGEVGAAALLLAPTLIAPPSADAAALSCTATVSTAKPTQYSNVAVKVNTGQSGARVQTVANYKTTKTTKASTSNTAAKAALTYYIASAKVGYKVRVDVTVTKGTAKKTCSTSFTPRAR